MNKQFVVVLPDEWKDDYLLSPEMRMTKQNLIQQAETYWLDSKIVYKSDYVNHSREKQLEVALKQLVSTHFFSKDLEWSWKEGYSLKELDTELWTQIRKLFPDVVDNK